MTSKEQLIRRESPEIVLGFLEPKVTGGGGGKTVGFFFGVRHGLIYTFGVVIILFWMFFLIRMVLFFRMVNVVVK